MNYQRIYDSIIQRGILRGLNKKKLEGYFEKHHIIPRCVGGQNEKSNYVLLTAKEHFICHMILPYLYPNSKGLWIAIQRMSQPPVANPKGLRVSAKTYEFFKLKANEEKAYFSSLREHKERERTIISQKAKQRWSEWEQTGEKEELIKRISSATSEAMKNPEIREKTRINKGSKWYTNIVTGESMHWYPGQDIPDSTIWRLGRPAMSENAKKKLSETQQKAKKKCYHNDEIKQNRMFKTGEIIPDGWIRGFKLEYSRKENTDLRKRVTYYNDLLKVNKKFYVGDEIPEGWIKGFKQEYSNSKKK